MIRDARTFAGLFRTAGAAANETIRALGGEPLDLDKAEAEVLPALERLRPCVADATTYLLDALDAKKRILLEGAQGAMLDIDFGTYPYVTSSNTTVGGCVTGSGLPPSALGDVHGLLKAFTTRVGAGPFPTELSGDMLQMLRGTGENQWDEFGTTTRRPRRCGWLDLVVARYSARMNGVTRLHVTKLDILSQFDELKICVAYRLDGKEIRDFPADIDDLSRCEPVYETLPGWRGDAKGARSTVELPTAAEKYVRRVSEVLGVKLGSVSFGPAREHTIVM